MSAALEVKKVAEVNDCCLLRVGGVIDETFKGASLLSQLSPITILDLEGIKRITSFGVRQWTDAMKNVPSQLKHLYLLRCQPSFIDQLNMVLNFGGASQVITGSVLYFCEKCQEDRLVSVDVLADRAKLVNGQLPVANCEVCSQPLKFEDDPDQQFRFVSTYGAKSLEEGAAIVLEQQGLYRAPQVDVPVEVTKLVHGNVTLFEISGMLNASFRPRRLVQGFEGDAVLSLGRVTGADDAGIAAWQKFLEGLKTARSTVLVDLAAPLLPIVASGKFSIEGITLHSIRANFWCDVCGRDNEMSVPVSLLFDGKQVRCPSCANPTTPSTVASILKAIRTMINPDVQLDDAILKVIDQRQELLSRARAESGQKSEASGLSRYRIVKPLSSGGMSQIFLAVNQGIGGFEKLIALKKIRREMLERRQIAIELFLNEAKIAANLNHPNIVQTFEIGEDKGDLFIAMEYIHGRNGRELLREAVTKQMPLSLEQALYITMHVAAGLHYAHEARDLTGRKLNIVHRDVSLPNIVISFDGQVKVVDFGIATASVVNSQEGLGLVGKFPYMSPEQIRCEPLDCRSDVFSLGIVLHEFITGKRLFLRPTDKETLTAVMKMPIPSLRPLVSEKLEQVVMTALSRDLSGRYQDAHQLEIALSECLEELGSPVDRDQLSQYMKKVFGDVALELPVNDSLGEQIPNTKTPDRSRGYAINQAPWEKITSVENSGDGKAAANANGEGEANATRIQSGAHSDVTMIADGYSDVVNAAFDLAKAKGKSAGAGASAGAPSDARPSSKASPPPLPSDAKSSTVSFEEEPPQAPPSANLALAPAVASAPVVVSTSALASTPPSVITTILPTTPAKKRSPLSLLIGMMALVLIVGGVVVAVISFLDP